MPTSPFKPIVLYFLYGTSFLANYHICRAAWPLVWGSSVVSEAHAEDQGEELDDNEATLRAIPRRMR